MCFLYLLDVRRSRAFSLKDDCYIQSISVRFCLQDKQTFIDDTHIEIPIEDHKEISIILNEPISPETLSGALFELGNNIASLGVMRDEAEAIVQRSVK